MQKFLTDLGKAYNYQMNICFCAFFIIINFLGCHTKNTNNHQNQEVFYLPAIHDKYPQIFTIDSLIFHENYKEINTLLSTDSKYPNEINNYLLGKILSFSDDEKYKNTIYEKLIKCPVNEINFITKLDISKYELNAKIELSFINELRNNIAENGINYYYKGNLAYVLARYHDERQNNLDSAWHYIMLSKEAFDKTGKITPGFQECLERITTFCTYKRKNLLAVRYANAMFDFERYLPKSDNVDTARAYANRAFIMFREGDFEGTEEDIEHGLSLIDPEKNPKIFQNLLKSRLVTNMIKKDDSLWHMAANNILSNIQITGKDHIEMNRWIGQNHTQNGEYAMAIPYLKVALDSEISEGTVHSARYSTLCFLLSQCYEELNDFDNALTYMALNLGFKKYENKDMIKNIISNTEYSFVTALRCANIYFSQYHHTQNLKSLLQSKKYLDVLDEVMFTQFKVADENAILQFYLESGQEYFHLGMDVHYELWKKTGDQQYLKSFIHYSDKNKNSLMHRDIQMANNLSALPPDMIQKEFELRAAIKEEKRKGLRGNRSFDQYMEEYARLEEEIGAKYKNFITHGLIKDAVNLKEVQQDVAAYGSSILIIDETQKYWYYTLINRHEIILDRQQIIPEKMLSIDTLLASIQKNQRVQKLKTDLLPNIIQSSMTKKMMYIPDGIYHRFPLSVILENKNYDIKHLPSISMYKAFSTPIKTPKSSAFFAFSDPETIKSKLRTRLNELPGTFKEVNRLSKQYSKAIIYSGKNATKFNFIKAYQDTNIQYIHLALHGLANSGEKDEVKLYFRTSKSGLDSLYGYELLKYKSKCKKIVLSACQSGLGTYEKGEGLFSLPRYFMINGATDVVFNYWDVED